MPLLDVFCPNGHPVPADATNARFCRSCGEPLLSHCPEGHTSVASGKFCTTCGSTMDSRTGEAPPAVPPTAAVPVGTEPESPPADHGEDAATAHAETPTVLTDGPAYVARPIPVAEASAPTQSGYAVGQSYEDPYKTVPVFTPGPPIAPVPAQSRRTGRGRIAAVVIAAILVLALAGGLVYVLRSKNNTTANSATATTLSSTGFHSTTPTTTHRATTHRATTTTTAPSEQVAAQGLATLLTQSVADRSDINAASNDVTSCGFESRPGCAGLRQCRELRQQLITQLSTLSGASMLPPTMIQDLTNAWQASAQVDDDYASWANDESSRGCTPNDTADPNYQAATTPTTGNPEQDGVRRPVGPPRDAVQPDRVSVEPALAAASN